MGKEGLCYTLNHDQEKQMSQIYKLPLITLQNE